MEKKTNKQYFTRKNFIAFAIVSLYALLLIFVALCINHTQSQFFSPKNPLILLADALRLPPINAGIFGMVYVALVAVYIIIFTVAFVFEKRLAYVNEKPQWSGKMIGIYLATLFCCLALSVGLGLLLQPAITGDNIFNSLMFLCESLAISLILFVVIGAFIVAVTMLIVNFRKVGKPFEFFKGNSLDDIMEEDESAIVSDNFDKREEFDGVAATIGGSVGGVGIGAASVAGAVAEAVKLDDREKVFPALSAIDVKYQGFTADKLYSDDVDLKSLCEGFRNYLAKNEKLYFDIKTVRMFVSGLAASRLLILEGLSGTGKSSLPRYFARYIGGNSTFLAVQATWRDRTNLLGYFNDFSKTYNETDFLSALYEANYDEDKMNIFVLDEFNISRVEYYFADFLSVLEYPPEDWKLRVMQLPSDFLPPVKLEEGNIRIPENCYFVATANKDDSTFSVADKVYDRAITIDFENRNEAFVPSGDYEPVTIGSSRLRELFDEAMRNGANAFGSDDLEKFNKVTDFIYKEFDIAVGNRVLNQIATIVPVYMACGGTKEEVLDYILARKVLKKLEGRFEDYLKTALKRLDTTISSVYGKGKFLNSESAIESLIKKL